MMKLIARMWSFSQLYARVMTTWSFIRYYFVDMNIYQCIY
ncbi:hypothetical protein MRBBS_0348 [Marinobacter sp. BSs20148]|nr:hypothetical protein MRBBS_0348 [Marinobacter sp. BSs20148]